MTPPNPNQAQSLPEHLQHPGQAPKPAEPCPKRFCVTCRHAADRTFAGFDGIRSAMAMQAGLGPLGPPSSCRTPPDSQFDGVTGKNRTPIALLNPRGFCLGWEAVPPPPPKEPEVVVEYTTGDGSLLGGPPPRPSWWARLWGMK